MFPFGLEVFPVFAGLYPFKFPVFVAQQGVFRAFVVAILSVGKASVEFPSVHFEAFLLGHSVAFLICFHLSPRRAEVLEASVEELVFPEFAVQRTVI